MIGVRGSGLSTTVLPAASAGATARIDRIRGKLNGEMMPTTPCGTRRAIDRRLPSDGSSRPRAWLGIAAASRQMPAAMCSSTPILGGIDPVSRISSGVIASPCCSNKSAALRKIAARSSLGFAAQARCAARAAFAAAATSPLPARPDSNRVVPVAGSRTGTAAAAAIHWPLNIRRSNCLMSIRLM